MWHRLEMDTGRSLERDPTVFKSARSLEKQIAHLSLIPLHAECFMGSTLVRQLSILTWRVRGNAGCQGSGLAFETGFTQLQWICDQLATAGLDAPA